MVFLNLALQSDQQRTGDEKAALGLVHLVLVAVVLPIGIVAAVVALAKMRRYGRERVLGRAIAGLLINSALLGVMGLGFASGLRRGRERSQADAEVKAAKAASERLLERAVAGEDVAAQGPDSMLQMAAALRKSAESADEPDRSTTLAMAEVTELAASAQRERLSSVSAFTQAGGISAAHLDSREAVKRRLAAIRTALQGLGPYEQAMNALPAQLRTRLEQRRVPADRIATVTKKYADSLHLEIIGGMCRTDRQLLEAAEGMFSALDASYGRWQVDATSSSIRFQDDDVLARYNALLAKVRAAASEQQEIQRSMARRKTSAAP